MEVLQYIFRIIQLLITLVVIALAGLLILTVLPVGGKTRALSVMSGSMEPTIKTGSVVVIKPADTYLTNEVVTFPMPGNNQLVTHRIMGSELEEGEKRLLTKGDANEELDAWRISQKSVSGKVVYTIPYLGFVTNWLKTPIGFVVAIVLPAAILIYGELMAIKNEVVRLWFTKKGIGVAVVLVLSSVVMMQSTRANMQDREVSAGNVVGVATCYNDSCVSPTLTETFTPTPTGSESPTAIESVKLNEFVPNGTGSSETDEWIELYNNSEVAYDLTGWKLKDVSGSVTTYIFPSGTTISGQGFLVFTKTVTGITLNNVSDGLVLLAAPDDTTIDSRNYLSDPGELVSIGRQNDGTDPWKTCTITTQGDSNNGSC